MTSLFKKLSDGGSSRELQTWWTNSYRITNNIVKPFAF